MPHTPEPKKKYYTIGEVAQSLEVAPSLIRFWEKKFPTLRPKKSAQGIRKYTEPDVALLQRIHRLVKEQGYTLAGARTALDGSSQQCHAAVIKKLREIRSFLVTLKDDPSARSSTG